MENEIKFKNKSIQVIKDTTYIAHIYMDNFNQRIELLKFSGDSDKLSKRLISLCIEENLSKIICILTDKQKNCFLKKGFIVEASINGYFKGDTAFYISYFGNRIRSISKNTIEEDKILQNALNKEGVYSHMDKGFNIRSATKKDSKTLAHIFKEIFITYPTEMNNPEYIEYIIEKNYIFKVASINGEIVSIASANMNEELLNAEITDCITLPEYRGKGLLSDLIYNLELDLREKKFTALYSIARALSTGMNIVLKKHDFKYKGRLINNCNIMGQLEDMNLWVKQL